MWRNLTFRFLRKHEFLFFILSKSCSGVLEIRTAPYVTACVVFVAEPDLPCVGRSAISRTIGFLGNTRRPSFVNLPLINSDHPFVNMGISSQ